MKKVEICTKNVKLKKLIRNNKEPYSRKIVNNLSSCEALEIEKHLIQEIGLDNLTNLCEGGFDGGSLKGEDHPFYGGMPDDIAQKISRNTTGYKMKENHNKNMKEALRGRELSEDHKNNISKAHTGKNITRGIKYQNH